LWKTLKKSRSVCSVHKLTPTKVPLATRLQTHHNNLLVAYAWDSEWRHNNDPEKGVSDMNTFKTSSVVPGERRSLALRLCLWAGIVGPLFFVLVFTIDGFLTPGYSAMRDVVSLLELGPIGWVQSLNFILTGLLLVLFALGFFQWMRPRSASGWLYVTTVLIALSGVGLIMAGPFLPDAPGTPQTSVHGILHTLAFTLVFLPLGIACLSVGGKFIRTAGWRVHGLYSLLAGLFPIFAALGNLFSSFVVSTAPKTPFSATSPQLEVGGLVNRLLVIVAFAWYVILASRMLIRERGEVKAPQQ
jgi:hypothetical membrane protein